MGDENIFIEERKGGERKKEASLGWELVMGGSSSSSLLRVICVQNQCQRR